MILLCGAVLLAMVVAAAVYAGSEAQRMAAGVFYISSTADTKEMGWYFKPNDQNRRPADTPERQMLHRYGGFGIGPDEPVIYLTFDLGYEEGYTAQILDTLKAHKVQAAFFVVEHYIVSEPELVRRMVEEGHLVCNHSTNHKNVTRLTDFEAFKEEVTHIETVYRDMIGRQMPKFFRPPEGVFSERALQYAQELGYTTVMWSFAYKDWEADNQPGREEALAKIYPRTHNGEIALLHATSATNAAILGEVLTEWKHRGFTFGSLNDLTPDVLAQE